MPDRSKRNTVGRRRREAYILQETGGKCSMCLSHWPSDVLCFHHLDPAKKKFGLEAQTWGDRAEEKVLKEAKKCVILCMNCHALEHKALNRGETLIDDPDAYLRYRNHRFTKQPDLFDRADMDDRNNGPGDEDQEEFPFAFV